MNQDKILKSFEKAVLCNQKIIRGGCPEGSGESVWQECDDGSSYEQHIWCHNNVVYYEDCTD